MSSQHKKIFKRSCTNEKQALFELASTSKPMEPMLQHYLEENTEDGEYQSHSLHFVFYTLSSGSCFCFAQSRQIDPVLPSFPYQNSETRAGSLADCPRLLSWKNLMTSPALMLNIKLLYCIIYMPVIVLYSSCFPDLS